MAEGTEAHPPQGAGEVPDEAFRIIVDANANPFVVLDRHGTIRYAGGSIERVLGWRPGELVGRSMADFLSPDQLPQAVEAIAEIEQIDRTGAGVPMVFEVLQRDGTRAWVEIGAMPMLDFPGVEGIVLRLRKWGSQHHYDEFVAALLADEPLADVLVALARSIAALVEAAGAAIHHGFDGSAFAAAAATGVPSACLLADDGPWRETAVTGEPATQPVDGLPTAAKEAAGEAGLRVCWTVPVPRTEGLAGAVVSVWREGARLAVHRAPPGARPCGPVGAARLGPLGGARAAPPPRRS